MKDFYCIITFFTTNYALEFEKKAKEIGMEVKLIPVPRELSSSCGTAARIDCKYEDDIKSFCKSNNIEIDRLYKLKSKETLIDKFKRFI